MNNADELGGWLRSVRGDTAVIVERQRPIVLRHHFAVHRREDDETLLLPLLQDNGKPGGEGLRIDQAVRRALQGRVGALAARGGARACPFRAPRRTEMVEELDQRRDAAGHRLHLQPGRLRRRRAPGACATASA